MIQLSSPQLMVLIDFCQAIVWTVLLAVALARRAPLSRFRLLYITVFFLMLTDTLVPVLAFLSIDVDSSTGILWKEIRFYLAQIAETGVMLFAYGLILIRGAPSR